jgi:hypothetical protein
MKETQYIISNNNYGIAVGLIGDKEETARECILCENIYGSNHSDNYFNSILYLPNIKTFKKFLILKEYYKVWDRHWAENQRWNNFLPTPPNIYRFTKEAVKIAKQIMNSRVTYENFMSQISSRNSEYQIGGYQDELSEE